MAVVDGGPEGQERIVGHLCVEPDGADTAEVAIAVADEFQHRGIGRRLLAAGAAWARRERIARFTATMLASNAPIHRLLIGLGAPTRLKYVGGGVAEITIDLVGPAQIGDASGAASDDSVSRVRRASSPRSASTRQREANRYARTYNPATMRSSDR